MSKVSIIIPIYNAEKFLKQCLDSIINQTYKNLEIICVNDGSVDNSLQLLKEYKAKDERVIIVDKKNAGVSEARNDGIRVSSGDYIAFVDSDDWLEKDAIENLYNALIENNVDIVRSTYYENESEEKEKLINNLYDVENQKICTAEANFVELVINNIYSGKFASSVWALLVKKECLIKTSLFQKNIPYAEDMILCSELLNVAESIYFLNKPTYHYFLNPVSCTKSKEYYIRNIHSMARAYEKLIELIEKDKFKKVNRTNVLINKFGHKIMADLFFMYISENKSLKAALKLIVSIMKDETVYVIVKETDVKEMPFHLSFPFKMVAKKRYKTLIVFYSIRKKMREIKLKIKKANI